MVTAPGFAHQTRIRTTFRVVGPLVLLAGLGCLVVAVHDLMTVEGFEEPTRFWLGFVGVPLLAVGGWLCMAGYGGAAARYQAGEMAPVLRDSASYLSDGRGVMGVGRTGARGRFCSECGQGNDAEARFCDACGTALRTG
jgi:hypothetical protein